MSSIAEVVWAALSVERPQGEQMWARLAAPDVTERLIAALDADGRRHLLVPLNDDDRAFEDLYSRGIGATTRELIMQTHTHRRYIDVVCQDPTGHAAFDIIGGEIAMQLATVDDMPAIVIERVLAKWRRFWGQVPRSIMPYEAQVGLFGELWFLRKWLAPKVGMRSAIDWWKGPLGSRHDFEWQNGSVEVKAGMSSRGRIFHINGIEQLAPPATGNLYFFGLSLRDEASGSARLSSLVAECREMVADDADAQSRLEALLIEAGYSPAHEPEYDKLTIRVVEEALFQVTGEFPRLTPASFEQGLAPGIERLEYEINLATFDRLVLASKAERMPEL